jgi:cytoskeletal protein CcmA (bactofilin family)
MFRRNATASKPDITPIERVTSVLGAGIIWRGSLNGKGGVRVEGTFEGEINLNGLLVVGESGRITCENVQANTVIVAGAIKGNITAEKLEIRSTGHVWGDVTIVAFSTEEGAFLRGNITMEDQVALDFTNATEEETSAPENEASQDPTSD